MTKVISIFASGFTLVIAMLFSQAASAGNWGHWRGPAGNGVSEDASPPTTWSESKNIQWKVPIPGAGTGSPVVWDDSVYVVTAVPLAGTDVEGKAGKNVKKPIPEMEFKILCFDRDSGKQKWDVIATTARPHEGTHQTNGYASASPCTDGQHVYAHFGSRGIYCYTMDGDFVWKRDDLGEMQIRFSFGEGSSPTIAGDKIIIPWDHQGDSYVLALNKRTGQTIWKTPRDEPSCWGTPLIVPHGSTHQVVMQGQNFARSYDLETGEELWRHGGQTFRPVATPVAEDGLVIVGSGFRGAFMGAFKLDGSGDIEGTTNVAWTIDRDTPDIASPVLSDGRLYYYKGKSGILSCVDAKTGTPHFSAQRVSGIRSTYASPIAAGGHIYLTDRDGTIVVIKDAPELNIVATNQLDDGVDATPAPSGDQLFIRGTKHLYCIAK